LEAENGRDPEISTVVAPLRIGFLVRALTVGGAERQLLAAARGLRDAGHDVRILVFYDEETPLLAQALEAGLPIVKVGKAGRWDLIGFVRRMLRHIQTEQIDVVYSFLPSANVVAAVAAAMGSRAAVVWSIRSSDGTVSDGDWLARAIVAIERRLACFADAIIVNSMAGLRYQRARGIRAHRIHLVRNGVDLGRFRASRQARERLRAEWHIARDEMLVVLAGRHDPVKGIETFLRAVSAIDARIAIVGEPSGGYTPRLAALASELGIADRVLWAGPRGDMEAVFNAADVVCSSSLFGEGTPNVLIEALACGAVVVGTAVGDVPEIVGDPERLAAPGSVPGLSKAIFRGLALGRQAPESGAADEVLRRYDMRNMILATERVLAAAVASRRAEGGRRGRSAA
jgi:glycosyltransferase involved in cell wall biosynthesis